MPGVQPDNNEPSRRRAASAAGDRVGSAATKTYHDGSMGRSTLGPKGYADSDVTSGAGAAGSGASAAMGMMPQLPKMHPSISEGQRPHPSRQYATDKQGNIQSADQNAYAPASDQQFASNPEIQQADYANRMQDWSTGRKGSLPDAGNGVYNPAPKGPTYYENPALQNELHEATGLKPTEKYSWGGAKNSQQQGGSSPNFFRALGGALSGYANPSRVGELFQHRGEQGQGSSDQAPQKSNVPDLPDTSYSSSLVKRASVPQYQDGDLNAQLDAAHKAEMVRGPTEVQVNGQDENQSPVTKSSPVAEQQEGDAHYFQSQPVFYPTQQDEPEYAARQGSDPYSKLPQTEVSSQDISDQSLIKNLMRNNPTQYSPILSHDEAEGGMPKHMAGGDVKPSRVQAIPPEKRLKVNGVTAPGYYQSTYMDGDMTGDPFTASSHPSHEGRDVSYGYSARGAFDADIARLRKQLDAEDAKAAAAKSTTQYYAPDKPPGKLPPNPYKDGDLTSKFAGRASKKKHGRSAHR